MFLKFIGNIKFDNENVNNKNMVLDKLVYEFLIVCSIVIRIVFDKLFTFFR